MSNRRCEWCGEDWRLADDPLQCGHTNDWYCTPEHSRADCAECYSEHCEGLLK